MASAYIIKKVVFFFIVLLCVWNGSKMPFFLSFDPESEEAKNVGLYATINLTKWIRSDGGYQGSKLACPAISFFLIHILIAITVLMLIAMTLIYPSWRRKYGYWTYSLGIALGVHTLPAALQHKLWIPFGFTCIYVIITSLLGFRTLRLYDGNPTTCERHLEIQHYVVAFGAWGAGFAEIFIGILPNIIKHGKTGKWPLSPHPEPNEKFGNTLYDHMSEALALKIFLGLLIVLWILVPMHMLYVDTNSIKEVALKNSSGGEKSKKVA
jgi:hypothetical protein